jgi:catechol 2,3-dioxygenase-like lactoylglutathione lyase family enzyme
MKSRSLPLICLIVTCLLASSVHGQVLPVSSGPVRMGHLHIISASPEAQKRFWTEGLGAEFVASEAYDVYKVPGVLIVVQKGSEREGTAGSVVNHIGMRVRDLKAAVVKCKAAGAEIESENAKQAMMTAPDRIRVELTLDDTLTTAVANHHIHLYGSDPDEMRKWYGDVFGATPGMRGPFKAADLPGVNLSFSQTGAALAGTEGRALDHIGFEVHGLEAFTHKLEENGLKLAAPYKQVPSLGIAIAFLRDPWGTYIELTEGLDRLP